jgi:hypothetical protein
VVAGHFRWVKKVRHLPFAVTVDAAGKQAVRGSFLD